MSEYLVDPAAEPDKDVEALETLLSPLAYKEGLDWDRVEARRAEGTSNRKPLLAALAVLAAAAVLIAIRLWPGSSEPAVVASSCTSASRAIPWAVSVLGGAPTCGGAGTSAEGALNTGGWIETDTSSSARVAVASVGEIIVSPGTRLELTTTSPDRHRLELRRGSIHASVDAPPRLFVVGTPAAEAVDLGCEYDLRVDGDGTAHIVVTGGAVSLEGEGRTVLVPAGFRARSLRDRGPTPSVSVEAPDEMFAAVMRFFAGRARTDLDSILAAATSRDTLTLEGLLPLVDRAGCEAVHSRLIELSPAPFPWDQTDYGCGDVAELSEAWRGLLGVETEQND